MFDGVSSAGVAWIVLTGAVVASSLGLLRNSTLRAWLISVCALAPVWLVIWATVMTTLALGWNNAGFWFGLVFVAVLLPPWLAVTVFPFKLITRVRATKSSG